MNIVAKKTVFILILTCLLLAVSNTDCRLMAQTSNSVRLLEMANKHFKALEFMEAIELYRDVLLEDNSLEAKVKLAQSYRNVHNYNQAEYWYRIIIPQKPGEYLYQLQYAQVLQSNGKLKEAKKWFLNYAEYDVWGKELAKGCDEKAAFRQINPDYRISTLSINSNASDFGPVFFNKGLLFCSDRAQLVSTGNSRRIETAYLDVYQSNWSSQKNFELPEKIKGKVNTGYNEGPICFDALNSRLYFTRNDYFQGKKSKSSTGEMTLQIYIADLTDDNKWENIQSFPYNSSEFSVAHPAITKDGQTLYFISNRPGGFGGTDIYACSRIDSVNWTEPVNMRDLNSPGNEMFPYIHDDGTIYFASNGFAGLGGLDIYYSKREGYDWTKPINMGKPVNSEKDDFSIILTKDKNIGFFCSNRDGGFGGDDIYRFDVGDVLNNQTLFAELEPSFEESVINLQLERILFDPGKSYLPKQAKNELDRLAEFMIQQPDITKIELGAHTSSRGDDFINLEMSKKRADQAQNYLIGKGVAYDRIIARGYGEEQLLNRCANDVEDCPEEMHKENDRLEVKLLSVTGGGMNDAFLTPQGSGFYILSEEERENIDFQDTEVEDDAIIDTFTNTTISHTTEIQKPVFEEYERNNDDNPFTIEVKERENKTEDINTGNIFEENETGKEEENTNDNEYDYLNTHRKGGTPGFMDEEEGEEGNNNSGEMTYEDYNALTYKIYIGPYLDIDNNTFYTFKELNTPMEIEVTERGNMIVLGPYNTTAETDEFIILAKNKGAKKAKVQVYDLNGAVRKDLKYNKLKKMGVE